MYMIVYNKAYAKNAHSVVHVVSVAPTYLSDSYELVVYSQIEDPEAIHSILFYNCIPRMICLLSYSVPFDSLLLCPIICLGVAAFISYVRCANEYTVYR